MAQKVDIKIHDGTILRGLFYPTQPKSPVVIMSPGLSGIKEHYLPNYAQRFQKAGYAALVYDHRNWGDSEGLPRHHSNHYEQTQDTHCVIHYVSTQLDIDPTRIALWGSSFSGGIALIAGAIDPRIKVVVSQVPFISGDTKRARLPVEKLAGLLADRGQTSSSDPTYIPIYPETLEQARDPATGAMMGTEECFRHYEDLRRLEPRRENKITLQSIFHTIRSEPRNFVSQISPKPLLMVVARKDTLISCPDQVAAFGKAGEPKELLEMDCGHFDVYRGESFERNVSTQIAFLDRYL